MADRDDAVAVNALDALRARGAQRVDPIRCHLIESLLRRAADHDGEARRVVDDKVAKLLQALSEQVACAEVTAPTHATVRVEQMGQAPHSMLAGLVGHIAQQKPRAAAIIEAAPSTKAKGALATTPTVRESPVDPKTLQFFKRTWSKLNSQQRLAQSRSSLPDNAGPLNSQHLVHRSLNLMRELSPEYFDLFISHVDALLWLEKANEQAAKEVGLSPRAKGSRKAAGTKRG